MRRIVSGNIDLNCSPRARGPILTLSCHLKSAWFCARRSHYDFIAVKKGFEQPQLRRSTFQPFRGDTENRLHHVTENRDAWNQAASKAIPGRNSIVVDFVFGLDRRVDGAKSVDH
jgi:hypothetical protein